MQEMPGGQGFKPQALRCQQEPQHPGRVLEVVLFSTTKARLQKRARSIPAGNGHLKPSRPRLVPARPNVCTSHVREPLCFMESLRFQQEPQHPGRVLEVILFRVGCATFSVRCAIQGYLAHKTQPPP